MAVTTLIWLAVFVVSLFVLVKASGFFTSAAEKLGVQFGIPPFIVGVTIVALGTSLPELVSSVLAVLAGSSEIVIGNVVGSNIANVLLVLGLSAVVGKKLQANYDLIRVDLPLFVGSAFLLAATVWDGEFTWPEGLLCLAALVVYLMHAVQSERRTQTTILPGKRPVPPDRSLPPRQSLGLKVPAVLLASAVFIYLGASYTIQALLELSALLSIGKEVIAASAVAVGTSLPELMVSITASRRGQAEMAIGNVLGSNIFNSLGVMGVSALIGTLAIPDSVLELSLPMMLMVTLLYLFSTQDKQITLWEGWVLLIFYLLYLGKLFSVF